MRILLFSIVLLINGLIIAQTTNPITPCPNKPNCVSSLHKKAKHKWTAFPMFWSKAIAMDKIKRLVLTQDNIRLSKELPNYLSFEVKTNLGKFIDDLEFYFNEKEQVIHYKSMSRIGYYDFGANKRRVKKLKKAWLAEKKQS